MSTTSSLDPSTPAISVLIPIYNGGQMTAAAYTAVHAALASCGRCEFLFGNDGSRDDSLEKLQALASAHPDIRIDTHENLGIGGTLNRLIAMARGDTAIYLDVDLSFNIAALPRLIASLDRWDIVTASRYIGGYHHRIPRERVLWSRLYFFAARLLLGVELRDIGSGMVVFRRQAVQSLDLRSNGFNWHVEFYDRARRKGLKLREYPVPYEHGTGGAFRISRHGPALAGHLIAYTLAARFRSNP